METNEKLVLSVLMLTLIFWSFGSAEAGECRGNCGTKAGDTLQIENPVNVNYEAAVSGSANLYSAGCVAGISGTEEGWAGAVAVDSQICTHLRIADAYRAALSLESNPVIQRHFQEQIRYHITAAERQTRATEATGLIGRIAAQLSIPAILLAALLL